MRPAVREEMAEIPVQGIGSFLDGNGDLQAHDGCASKVPVDPGGKATGSPRFLDGDGLSRWPSTEHCPTLPPWRPLRAAWRTLPATPRTSPRSATGSSLANWGDAPGGGLSA